MGFSRQEFWSGLPFPSPGDLPDPGIKQGAPTLVGRFLITEPLLLLLSRFSRVRLLVTPWTAAYEAPPPMEFSRQEFWSGLPFPSPGDLPDPGTEPGSPALQADALLLEPPAFPYKSQVIV